MSDHTAADSPVFESNPPVRNATVNNTVVSSAAANNVITNSVTVTNTVAYSHAKNAGTTAAARKIGHRNPQQCDSPPLTKAEINAEWRTITRSRVRSINQASNLPNSAKLPEIQEKLTGKENWRKWGHNIKETLKRRSLSDLIDSEILRPRFVANDLVAERRRSYSEMVSYWPLDGVSGILCTEIKKNLNHDEDIMFADDVWGILETECKNYGVSPSASSSHHFAAEGFQTIFKISPANYDTLEEYTSVYAAAYAKVEDSGHSHDRRALLALFLMGVETFDSGISSRVLRELYGDGIDRENFTERYFDKVVHRVNLPIVSNKAKTNAAKSAVDPDRTANLTKISSGRRSRRIDQNEPLPPVHDQTNHPPDGVSDE